jgi:O-antigen ligase
VEPLSEVGTGGHLDELLQQAILACVLFVLVWSPLAFGSTGPVGFLVIQCVTILALGLWAVRWWVQRPFRLFWPPVCWGVLAFLFYALPRCQVVDLPYVGREQLMHVIVYAALFFIVLHNLNGKDSATIVAMTLIIMGFCLSFLAVVQFVRHPATIWGLHKPAQYISRGGATFINPNNFAGYLEMIIPLALAYAITSRFGAVAKVLLGYAVLAMVAGVFVTLSRGGVLSVAASLVFFCLVLLAQRDFWLPALVTLAALLLAGLVFAGQFESLQRRFTVGIQTAKSDPSVRLMYWHAAQQLYANKPIWGVGPGHYDVKFSEVRPPGIQDRPKFAHNDYLNTLCEWGTVGMVVIAATVGLLAWGSVRTWRAVRRSSNDFGTGRRSDRTAFLVGACVGLFAIMLHCTVEFNMQIPADAMTAIILMSLIAAQGRFATEGYWKNPGLAGKAALTALAAGAVFILGADALHRGRETYWLRRARFGKITAEQASVCLEKAHEIEPANAQIDYVLGEGLRLTSKEGNAGYQDKARDAIEWFGRGMEANSFDARFPLRIGMCLDWIDRAREATPYFDLAQHLEPNDYYVALEKGRHFVALGDLKTAKYWMQYSMGLRYTKEADISWALVLSHMADPLFLPHK